MDKAHDFDLESMAPFFLADSLAVIGASSDPRKTGGRPIRWAKLGGFCGKVYPINPTAREVQGFRAYASLEEVEGPVDCAFIALPAAGVEDAVRACAAKGVRAAVIISAGFAETGDEGRRLQERIVAIARAAGMRLIGPNCMGVMNVAHDFYPAFLTLFDDEGTRAPKLGSLGLVSQSGAFGAHAYELARARGIGFSKWVTTGNQCDVQLADCLAYFAEDADTKAIVVYMEGAPEPGRLIRALELARARGKPVVLLKSGRSEIGRQAALSHTGSLAGSDEAFNALCAQTGVHRARTIDELLDIGVASSHGKYLGKPQVGLVTISGGVGALMADYAEELGLAVPALPADAQESLLRLFPAGSARNPIDPTGLWTQDPSVFGASLRALFGRGGHEAAVVFLSTGGTIPGLEAQVLEQVQAVRREFPDRLVVVSMIASADVLAKWRSAGILVYEEPRRALEVIAALARFGSVLTQRPAEAATPLSPPQQAVTIEGKLSELGATELLERAGIPFAPRFLATSRAAAERAAAGQGYPVVLKLVSPDIAHKSEIGGVVTGLMDQNEVGRAYDLIMQRGKEAAPGADLHGVLVARQIVGGVETILGVSRDPAVGPVVMFGIGGLFVEIYKDVAFRVAPVSVSEAHAMIREVKGFAVLNGARGKPPMDLEALAQAISRLSEFAVANAETIGSIDINPFIVLPRGEGAFGVDALIEGRAP